MPLRPLWPVLLGAGGVEGAEKLPDRSTDSPTTRFTIGPVENHKPVTRAPHQPRNPGAPLEVIAAKVSTAEAEALARAAEAEGITRSGLLRRLLTEHLDTERAARAVAALPSLIVSPSTSSAGAVSVSVEAHRAA